MRRCYSKWSNGRMRREGLKRNQVVV